MLEFKEHSSASAVFQSGERFEKICLQTKTLKVLLSKLGWESMKGSDGTLPIELVSLLQNRHVPACNLSRKHKAILWGSSRFWRGILNPALTFWNLKIRHLDKPQHTFPKVCWIPLESLRFAIGKREKKKPKTHNQTKTHAVKWSRFSTWASDKDISYVYCNPKHTELLLSS